MLQQPKSINNLDIKTFLEVNSILPWNCNCEGSDFLDKHQLHIVTGDFGIIKNHKSRTLFPKGPTFKENNIS